MSIVFILLCFSLFSLSPKPSLSSPTKTPTFPSLRIHPKAPQKPELYETKYFTQTLDHFNFLPQSYKTFQQRYLISRKYWAGAQTNAPIFVYTGNEGDIEWFAQNTGFMIENAPHFKALLVFIEVLRKVGTLCTVHVPNLNMQACTEMIMPVSGSNKESIYPEYEWSYSSRASACEGAYGVEPRPNWITSEFGGHNIERVLKRFGSNIIFFNGLRDPWSGGGVLRNISDTLVAIVEKQGAHHVDLRFSTSEDPKWLQDVRKREVNIIANWISDYYHDLS